jgi:S-adenosylhomocysteine hydrolase
VDEYILPNKRSIFVLAEGRCEFEGDSMGWAVAVKCPLDSG